MAYIYQITNDVNEKVYIGKTEFSIEKRFKEHCRDRLKRDKENRPLYRAMNKYGIEHFHIELLEETDNPEEREKFWIEEKRSFKNGYNATLGGDGKKYLDYDILIAAYQELQNLEKVSQIYGCDTRHLSNILKSNNVQVKTHQDIMREQFSFPINQYSLSGEYIQTFATARDAARYVRPDAKSIGGNTSHITDVCKGKRKTAYGFIWKYAKPND